MKDSKPDQCFFCDSKEDIRLPIVGISLSMWGDHYSFCGKCLDETWADGFWEEFFRLLDYSYPPKLKRPMSEHVAEHKGDEPPPKKKSAAVIKATKQDKERGKLSNALRYKILKRDGLKCVLCGRTSDEVKLAVDHIHPISNGGKTVEDNLRALCYDCNSGKGCKVE